MFFLALLDKRIIFLCKKVQDAINVKHLQSFVVPVMNAEIIRDCSSLYDFRSLQYIVCDQVTRKFLRPKYFIHESSLLLGYDCFCWPSFKK